LEEIKTKNPMLGVYCNRTLNLKSIKAIGYDMDYTLVNYYSERWENRAYNYLKQYFLEAGWPVAHLSFDPNVACRGLIIDQQDGNIIKANRFGFIKQALHGSHFLNQEQLKKSYARTLIDLSEKRWIFLNTLFSLSEGCIYSQLVDLLDQKKIPMVLGYSDLYQKVVQVLEAAHMEGQVKAEIMADPEQFILLDPLIPQTLLDQKFSGKKIILITNSEWPYVNAMMQVAIDQFMPSGMKWKDLFDLVIVSARKPVFFTSNQGFFEIVTESGLLKPNHAPLEKGRCYYGGSALRLEEALGVSGDELLYVGDHMFADVHVTKNILRWRTALILKELEQEIAELQRFSQNEKALAQWMQQKEAIEQKLFLNRLQIQRGVEKEMQVRLEQEVSHLRAQLDQIDHEIGPLAKQAAGLSNASWGLLMRAGNDKSYLAYQLERYADIYTSKVSNLMNVTPFAYLRSKRGLLPHE
jgi:HAD superfamily 5'-nucleotidase-like hydrolase